MSFRTGSEAFHSAGHPLGPTVSDFWRWAYSTLHANNVRGHLAEYLVARAIGADARPRVEWNAYDLETAGGLRVEVKACGRIQSWPHIKPSEVAFVLGAKRAWFAETNTYAREVARVADVYVFCLHHHLERDTIDPLDLSQWTMFVLGRARLEARLGRQKTARLSSLLRAGARQVEYASLASAIDEACKDGT